MGSERGQSRGSQVQRDSHTIENRQGSVRLPMADLKRFLGKMYQELGVGPTAVFVCMVTDAEMKRLNQKFRNKAKTTDVLSFPWEIRTRQRALRGRAGQIRGAFLGDIAISPTVARRNAKMFGRTMREELCVLMLHGVLHLMGYDHETDRGEMERVEAKLRRRLGLAQ